MIFRRKSIDLYRYPQIFWPFIAFSFCSFLREKGGIKKNIFIEVIQKKVETFDQRGHDAALKKVGQPEVNND